MLTAELVTLIAQEVGASWSRALILGAINRAQNEILGTDNDLCRIKPDPFMTTTDLTYGYVATNVLFDSSEGVKGSAVGDVRTVRKIYSFATSLNIFGFTPLDPGSARPYRILRSGNQDCVGAPVDFVQSKEPDSSDCLIKWWEGNNPGSTTVLWRAEAYKWPAQLLSESIALTIPDDYQDTLLMEGVLKRIQRREFGRDDDRVIAHDRQLKRFRSAFSSVPNQDGPLECRPLNV